MLKELPRIQNLIIVFIVNAATITGIHAWVFALTSSLDILSKPEFFVLVSIVSVLTTVFQLTSLHWLVLLKPVK